MNKVHPARRRLLAWFSGALLGAAIASPALAHDRQASAATDLDRVGNYLNAMTTAEGPFMQHNADGTMSTGTFSISRPGKLRMDYDGPKSPLIVASAGRVAIFDRKYRNSPPEQYPLAKTPLGPLLARHVDLARSEMIAGQSATEDRINVWARDPDHPEYGTGRFSFTRDPIALKSWTMTNDGGETTHVEFGTLAAGMKLPMTRFSIASEIEKIER